MHITFIYFTLSQCVISTRNNLFMYKKYNDSINDIIEYIENIEKQLLPRRIYTECDNLFSKIISIRKLNLNM